MTRNAFPPVTATMPLARARRSPSGPTSSTMSSTRRARDRGATSWDSVAPRPRRPSHPVGRFAAWVIELITNIVLIALAVGLGPFIKRFGRAYAADAFRANPRTGKSYLVLTDVAYYLIFTSFVLFTVTFVEPSDWVGSTGAQLKHEVARIGGILLIMGVLHALNVVALPVIGGLLSNNNDSNNTAAPHPRPALVLVVSHRSGPAHGSCASKPHPTSARQHRPIQ